MYLQNLPDIEETTVKITISNYDAVCIACIYNVQCTAYICCVQYLVAGGAACMCCVQYLVAGGTACMCCVQYLVTRGTAYTCCVQYLVAGCNHFFGGLIIHLPSLPWRSFSVVVFHHHCPFLFLFCSFFSFSLFFLFRCSSKRSLHLLFSFFLSFFSVWTNW